MSWTLQRVREEFGEDVLRDITRDINDLMCGMAGHGHHPNRIGVPDDLWRLLLRAGGYKDTGIKKIMAGQHVLQEDTELAFTPYTVHNVVNVTEDKGGPLTAAQLDQVLTCALRYRQLIE